MGRTHALSGLVAGMAAGHFWWHLDSGHLAVAPTMVAALAWLVAVVAKVLPAGRLPLR